MGKSPDSIQKSGQESSPAGGEDVWQPDFLERSPLLQPLEGVAAPFAALEDWPSLNDFNTELSSRDLPVRAVSQDGRPDCFERHYEPRIYLHGELQTRLRNWHDFFNALVWLRFPKTKTALNRLHFQAASQRPEKTNRSPLENALTRFDECGAILISSRPDLLDHVVQHEWTELFWNERDRFGEDIRCLVFGHATFEKALTPYVGMTTSTVLLHRPDLLSADLERIDQALANWWETEAGEPHIVLKPLPVLGIPGWYPGNENPAFYGNSDYFRPKRR